MLRNLIEKVDIYLIILIIITSYNLLFSDVKYFAREKKEKAKKQSLGIGIVMFFVVIGVYIIKLIWL